MIIKEVVKSTVFLVTTDEDVYNEYTRYSATNWTVRMGESDEPVYDCKELEDLFQVSHKIENS